RPVAGSRQEGAGLVFADGGADRGARRDRHRRPGARRPGRRRAVGRDPRLRRRHRPAGLGLGPGQSGQCQGSCGGPDVHPRHPEYVDHGGRRRGARP
ncbi:hypothetical protein LTR94_037006, partial [Friedmanniomyces endolithicus]